MKTITVTEEQKVRLLEMCNKLFPQYNKSFEIELEGQYDGSEYMLIFYCLTEHNVIHWFEFCLTHLAEKIIATYEVNVHNQRVYKRTLNDDLSKFYLKALDFSRGFNKQHPIDYLYSEFKKLK